MLQACNGIIYDDSIVELLLNLLANENAFRIITMKIICSIICHLVFNKKLESSLKSFHVRLLFKSYHSVI